jgi:hypothetical protein
LTAADTSAPPPPPPPPPPVLIGLDEFRTTAARFRHALTPVRQWTQHAEHAGTVFCPSCLEFTSEGSGWFSLTIPGQNVKHSVPASSLRMADYLISEMFFVHAVGEWSHVDNRMRRLVIETLALR